MTHHSLNPPHTQGDIQHLRAAYDAFLARFPLCYGYWKKYAEAERRHGSSATGGGSSGNEAAAGDAAATTATAAADGGVDNTTSSGSVAGLQAAEAVYQRGVAAVPHSAELWVAYAAMLQSSDAPTDAVRRWVGADCITQGCVGLHAACVWCSQRKDLIVAGGC